MKLVMLDEAAAEFDEAVEYYAQIRPKLARGLVKAFSIASDNIEINPDNHPYLETLPSDLNIRRAILKRFRT